MKTDSRANIAQRTKTITLATVGIHRAHLVHGVEGGGQLGDVGVDDHAAEAGQRHGDQHDGVGPGEAAQHEAQRGQEKEDAHDLRDAEAVHQQADDDAQEDAGEHRRRDEAGELHIRQMEGGIDAGGDRRDLVVAVVADELRREEQRGDEKYKVFTFLRHGASRWYGKGF